MKLLVVLSVLVVFAAAAPSGEVELLSAFDFDALLKNDEQRKAAFDCLLDKGDCGELKAVRDAVIKVISNKCAECNSEQRAKYDHVLKMFHDTYEPTYNEVMKKIATQKQ